MNVGGPGSSDEVRAAWHQARAEAVNILREKGFTEAGNVLLGIGVDGSGFNNSGAQNGLDNESDQREQQPQQAAVASGAELKPNALPQSVDGSTKLGSQHQGQGPVIMKQQLFTQNQQTIVHGDGIHVTPNNIISSFASADREPKRFADAYKKLKTWINAITIDFVKKETSQLLYPIFVHLFLELMMRKSEADKREARTFFKQFAGDHKTEHRTDVQAFEKVVSVDALKKDSLCQTFLSNRYIIHTSATGHDVLMKYLRKEQLYPVLHVMNNHIHFKIVDEKKIGNGSLQNGPHFPNTAKLNGYVQHSDDINSQPMKLLWGSLKDRVQEENGKIVRNTNSSSFKVEDTSAASKDASECIPIPQIDYSVMIRELEDARNRIRLSTDTLPSVAMFTAQHSGASINCMDFTSDGSTIACGFSDSTIRVFKTEEHYNSRMLRGHAGPVYGTSFSPNARLLASCSTDGSVCLWGCEEALGNGPLVNLRGHSSACWDVQFASLGHYIASASRDRTARVWSTDRAQPLRVMAGHISDVDIVKWHPNCNYIATGSSDRTIRLWDVQSGETVRLLTGHSGSVTALEFSPDGYTIASGGDTGAVLIWDLRNGRRVATLKQHTLPVWSLAFEQENGELLASSAADCSVRLWNCSALTASVKTEHTDSAPTVRAYDNSHGVTASSNQSGQGGDAEVIAGRQPRLLKVLYTKSTPVIHLQFTKRNLLLAGGAIDLSLEMR